MPVAKTFPLSNWILGFSNLETAIFNKLNTLGRFTPLIIAISTFSFIFQLLVEISVLLNKCQRHSEFCNPFTGFVQGVTALHCSVLYLLCRYFLNFKRFFCFQRYFSGYWRNWRRNRTLCRKTGRTSRPWLTGLRQRLELTKEGEGKFEKRLIRTLEAGSNP